MIVLLTGAWMWLINGHTDMCPGMNGRALQVQQALQHDPHAGDLSVFPRAPRHCCVMWTAASCSSCSQTSFRGFGVKHVAIT